MLKKAGEITMYEDQVIKLCKQVSLGKLKEIIKEFSKPKGHRKNNRKAGIYTQVPIEVNSPYSRSNRYTPDNFVLIDNILHWQFCNHVFF